MRHNGVRVASNQLLHRPTLNQKPYQTSPPRVAGVRLLERLQSGWMCDKNNSTHAASCKQITKANNHRSFHQMRNDIILGRNNLKVESEEERQKSDRRLRKMRRGGANFLQLLYLPADFLYPIILNLKATTLKKMFTNAKSNRLKPCAPAARPLVPHSQSISW